MNDLYHNLIVVLKKVTAFLCDQGFDWESDSHILLIISEGWKLVCNLICPLGHSLSHRGRPRNFPVLRFHLW